MKKDIEKVFEVAKGEIIVNVYTTLNEIIVVTDRAVYVYTIKQ